MLISAATISDSRADLTYLASCQLPVPIKLFAAELSCAVLCCAVCEREGKGWDDGELSE